MILLDICTECTWQIIPMLLGAWLLGWLFWWLFNRSGYQTRISEIEKDRDGWHTKATGLEADLSTSRYEHEKAAAALATMKNNYGDLELRLRACEEDKLQAAPTVAAATMVAAGGAVRSGGDRGFASIFKNDNLQIVEGIGPKIEGLLHAEGIKTWAQLADTKTSRLQAILDAAGSNYKIHDPSTWAHQAKLANEGKWKELEEYQLFLGGGKDTGATGGGEAKITKMAARLSGFSSANPNDLKVVEGIGPKIEGLLKDGGIKNWSQLASSKVERLQEILDAAGDNYKLADPGTWPRQAELAAAGKWGELKEYQDFLQGGK